MTEHPDSLAATGTEIAAPASAGAGTLTATAEQYGDVIQVVVIRALQQPLRDWLTGRGLYLFLIPVEDDDLPTYGIGVRDPA